MIYRQYLPHPSLAPYIDAYWTAKGSRPGWQSEKILPDGCIDIILNLGDSCLTDDTFKIENQQVYLVGTMTRYKQTMMSPETSLLGVRFKPGGFTAFFPFDSLDSLVNETVLFEQNSMPHPEKNNSYSSEVFDRFFLSKLEKPAFSINAVLTGINRQAGLVSVAEVAKACYTTPRQLERLFNKHIGVSPKEVISLVRYQFAMQAIKGKSKQESLMQIAFKHGYYDHAHMTNEIKKYTGSTPSEF